MKATLINRLRVNVLISQGKVKKHNLGEMKKTTEYQCNRFVLGGSGSRVTVVFTLYNIRE